MTCPRRATWKLLSSAAVLVVGLTMMAARAEAQFQPAGAITGHVAFGTDSVGGGLLGDITAPFGPLRIGGALGIVALSSDNEAASRVFVPLGVSLGLVGQIGDLWLEARVRGGMWAGPTNEGLSAGPWLSPGGYIGVALGPRVALGAGVEGWFAFGGSGTVAVAPGVTLMWIPEAPEE